MFTKLFLNSSDILLNFISKYLKLTLWYWHVNAIREFQSKYQEIDVVIPLIEKDILNFQSCVQALKRHSLNPIRNIYIVAPFSDKIKKLIDENNLNFVHEDKVTKITSHEISTIIASSKMVGWLKQQLVKLNIDSIDGILPYVLVIDSDTILCKDQCFINGNKIVLKYSDEFHLKYKLASSWLLNKCSKSFLSYISHHQIFNIYHLKELRDHVESCTRLPFNLAFLESYKKFSLVSEYELYGQFVLMKYPSIYILNYWFNLNRRITSSIKAISPKALSYSLHNYDYK
jgi:hypothetical protein